MPGGRGSGNGHDEDCLKFRVWIKAALYRVTRWGTGSGSARVMAMCSIGVTELRGNMK